MLLGEAHAGAKAYCSFAQEFNRVGSVIESSFEGDDLRLLLPQFMHHNQLEFYRYMNSLKNDGSTVSPRFQELTELIESQQWSRLPDLPARYLVPLGPA